MTPQSVFSSRLEPSSVFVTIWRALLHKLRAVSRQGEAAADDFRRAFHAAGLAVDGDDGQHDAIFGKVAPVANDHLLHHVVHRAGIDAHTAHGDAVAFARAVVVDFQNVARFHDESLFQAGEAQVLGQAGVLGELAKLAVDGHEVARAHQVQDQLLLLRAGMAGDVQRRVHAAVQDVGAAARHVVDHAEDGLFVAGDDAGAEHHGVALFHGDVLMVIDGHARQRRHGFALGAGDEDGHFVGRQAHGILGAQQDAVGNIQQAERVRDLGHRHHASANHRHAAAEFLRQIEDQLDAVDGGTEAGDHYPALGAVENLFHARADGALALGEAGAVGVGGIGEQQQDAALAVVGEGVEIEQLVIGGSGVDLEIAGVNDHSERRGNGQGHGAHDGVRHVDELDFEGADVEDLFGLDGDEAGLLLEVVLFQAALHQGQREIGAVDRDSDIGKEIRDGADVVLMAVGEDQGADELAGFP